jgi:hypothetical protein
MDHSFMIEDEVTPLKAKIKELEDLVSTTLKTLDVETFTCLIT